VNKLNNLNVDYMKVTKTHRGPHKTPSPADRVLENPGFLSQNILFVYKDSCKFALQFEM